MPDMLVKLYDLPSPEAALAALAARDILVRRALLPEQPLLLDWASAHFAGWSAELGATFSRLPVSCFIALRGSEILGFAAYDAIGRNFFGPTGVLEAERGRGIGRALLLVALHAQREQGYAYAIIGGVGPAGYYEKAVGARPIEGSDPGIYAGMLRPPET